MNEIYNFTINSKSKYECRENLGIELFFHYLFMSFGKAGILFTRSKRTPLKRVITDVEKAIISLDEMLFLSFLFKKLWVNRLFQFEII